MATVAESTGPSETQITVASSPLPPIDKLEGESNWANWKYLMELYLGLDDLGDCILAPPSEDMRSNPLCAEMKKDFKARSKILLMAQKHLIIHVRTAKTVFEAWNNLCNVF
jgi:hypothetical protein